MWRTRQYGFAVIRDYLDLFDTERRTQFAAATFV